MLGPGSIIALDDWIDRQDASTSWARKSGGWNPSVQCQSSGLAGQRVVSVLHPQELKGRGGWALSNHALQGHLHLLILPACLGVGMGMKTADCRPQQFTERAQKSRCE